MAVDAPQNTKYTDYLSNPLAPKGIARRASIARVAAIHGG